MERWSNCRCMISMVPHDMCSTGTISVHPRREHGAVLGRASCAARGQTLGHQHTEVRVISTWLTHSMSPPLFPQKRQAAMTGSPLATAGPTPSATAPFDVAASTRGGQGLRTGTA